MKPRFSPLLVQTHHEAAHAIVWWACGLRVLRVVIENEGAALYGYTFYAHIASDDRPQWSRSECQLREAVGCLAGAFGIARLTGLSFQHAAMIGCDKDLSVAKTLLRGRPLTVQRQVAAAAQSLVSRHWVAVQRLARSLQQTPDMNERALLHAIRGPFPARSLGELGIRVARRGDT